MNSAFPIPLPHEGYQTRSLQVRQRPRECHLRRAMVPADLDGTREGEAAEHFAQAHPQEASRQAQADLGRAVEVGTSPDDGDGRRLLDVGQPSLPSEARAPAHRRHGAELAQEVAQPLGDVHQVVRGEVQDEVLHGGVG